MIIGEIILNAMLAAIVGILVSIGLDHVAVTGVLNTLISLAMAVVVFFLNPARRIIGSSRF